MPPVASYRSRTRVLALALLLLGMVIGALVLRVADGSGPGEGAAQLAEGTTLGSTTPSPTTPPDPVPGVSTRFTLSSLNVLGADHTAPGGNRTGWASGAQRMTWLVQVILRHDVDVVGLQEFQPPQYDAFMAEAGSEFAMYPGNQWGRSTLRNSIAWRVDTWEFVSASWIRLPYFHGTMLKMPVVLLRNIETGQQAYFANFQLPSDTRGNAEKWRDQGTALQIGLVNRLRTQTGLPFFQTGDMNEKAEYFCKMTSQADMVSASGGTNDSSGCLPTPPLYVDWIFGSVESYFTGYLALDSRKVRKSTDHHMIVTQVELPPVVLPTDCPTTTPQPTAKSDTK